MGWRLGQDEQRSPNHLSEYYSNARETRNGQNKMQGAMERKKQTIEQSVEGGKRTAKRLGTKILREWSSQGKRNWRWVGT